MKWLDNLLVHLHVTLRNELHVRVDTLKNRINAIELKRTSVKYLGWGLLYMDKPFTSIGNWFWKLHRTVLDWNK